MKRIIAMAALTTFVAGTAMAADTMVFPAKMGNVTFNHKMHQQMLKNCKVCHEKGPGKIEGFGKDFAHKVCKGCHEKRNAGPTTCGGCHKK